MAYDEEKVSEFAMYLLGLRRNVDLFKPIPPRLWHVYANLVSRLEACRVPDPLPDDDAVEVLVGKLKNFAKPPLRPVGVSEESEALRKALFDIARYVLSHYEARVPPHLDLGPGKTIKVVEHYGRGETVLEEVEHGCYWNVLNVICHQCRWVASRQKEQRRYHFCPHCGAKAVEEEPDWDGKTERRKGGNVQYFDGQEILYVRFEGVTGPFQISSRHTLLREDRRKPVFPGWVKR